jgi:hypothetical protein
MASFTKLITASSGAALATAANTFLAGLTAPTIRGMTLSYNDEQASTKAEWVLAIDYTDGGSALATPFLLSVLEKRKVSDLESAVQALMTANPTYFYAATRYAFSRSTGAGKLPKSVGVIIYNTTAGASANWSPR